jgi:SAM-dependent methyltransferase
VTPTPWSPAFELDYVRQTNIEELLRRHGEHSHAFDLRSHIDALPEQATVMEVGCGAAGGLLVYVPFRHTRIAVDPLVMQYPWMPDGFEKREEFAHALSQADDTVDLLICIETLDHCDDMEQFVTSQRELARVLKVGGTLLFMLPARSGPCDAHPCCPDHKQVIDTFKGFDLHVERHDYGKREGLWLCLKKR